MMKKFVFLLLIATSCTVAPPYTPPDEMISQEWKGGSSNPSETILEECWWLLFQEEALNELEQSAILNSPNLEKAYFRIIESWQLMLKQNGNFYPQLSLNPSASSQGILYKTFVPVGPPELRVHEEQYTFPLTLSYEADLFGRIQNGYYAACATMEAREEAYQALLLSLTADVASTYFQVRSYDAQIFVLQNTIRARKDALEINQARYSGGIANYTDVSRAATALAAAEADLSEVLRFRANAENLLATLCGIEAPTFCLPPSPLVGEPSGVPLRFPAELLHQRPDIRERERLLAAACYEIGVAEARRFPSLILGGSLGYSTPTASDLFQWKTRLWAWGADALQVIFDGGKIRADIEQRKAIFYQVLDDYEQTVLIALEEVENNLADLHFQAERAVALDKAIHFSQETLTLSQERYLKGLVSYLEVNDAERQLLDSQLAREQMRGEQFRATVFLIKAMGGGLNCDQTEEAIPELASTVMSDLSED